MNAKNALPLVALFFAFGCGEGEEIPSNEAPDSAGLGDTEFLKGRTIGDPVTDKPWVTNLIVIDLDEDGLPDVVHCDSKLNQVRWIRQTTPGQYTETQLGDEVRAPAHISASDFDLDGDLDLLVACMGVLLPNNNEIGSVVLLENIGDGEFQNRTIIEGIRRVTDVRAADFDGDGDSDLAVGAFGYDEGEIRWMENNGDGTFESHSLLQLSGTIHTPVADMDGDGDLDITAIVSQEWEEVYVFENDGGGNFTTHMVYGSTNEDFGSSGIELHDLDHDGDLDVLYTNGDSFDYLPPGPRPWHGLQWLENEGGLRFAYHRIGDFPGAYSAKAVDIDGDGDDDIFAVSQFNDWSNPKAQSFVWFENDGSQNFTLHPIASEPTHQLVLDVGDMDLDGDVDFISGGIYFYPPFDRMGRIQFWENTSGIGSAVPSGTH